MDSTRRRLVTVGLLSSASLVLGACAGRPAAKTARDKEADDDEEVGAVEDLMREHGVLRRALIVYRESATRLRKRSDVPPDALRKTAQLFRAFGEEYHEKKLEEAVIFPAVKRAGGPAALLADVLTAQHLRGREITDYVIATTSADKIGANADVLADVLEAFARMYESHAAREDTIVFPAWKKTMSKKALDEIGDTFEDIEHQQFGKDGFDDAVKTISAVEATLGLSDVGQLTAPPPPKPPG